MDRRRETMTTAEFARATGIPAASVTRLIREGKLRARKEGKTWKIPASQLDAPAVRRLGGPKPGKQAAGRKAGPPRRRPLEQAPAAAPPGAMPSAPAESPEAVSPAAAATAPQGGYSIPEFAAMTYLTEQGIREWLKIGRLRGVCTPEGEWRVLEDNLSAPDIRRLLRK